MLSLLSSFILIAWLLSPSRDHLRSQIGLDDRRRLDCRSSSMDGRRPNVSAYAPQSDLDLHSSEQLIVCQQRILEPGLRPTRSDDLLQNSQAFTVQLLRQMHLERGWQERNWTVEVLIAAPELQQKLSFAVKTQLVQSDFKVRNRAVASEALLALGLEEWQQRCSTPAAEAQLFVYLPHPQSSQLGAAACTAEGWKWL